MSTADATAPRDEASHRPGRKHPRPLGTVDVPTSGLVRLRRSNLALVARTLLQRGAPARAELARATGLSATSITKITAQMKRARLLTEHTAVSVGDTGRPRVPVALDTTYFRFLGIHIGLRRTTGGLLDLAGNLVTEVAITHRRRSKRAILAEAQDLRQELERVAGGPQRILGTGVATGGRVDPTTGVVVDHPMLGWSDVGLASALGSSGPIFVDSSVRAMALAESYLGVARDADSCVFLFIGNIVGAGVRVDGRLHLGHEAAAGTIDHLPVGTLADTVTCHCGSTSCLSAVASDVAVLKRARAAGLARPHGSFETLIASSRNGSEGAARLLRQRAEYAGVAAGVLLDLVDPDLLVLGGGLLQTPEYLDVLRETASDRTSRPEAVERIVPTGLGDGALVKGSASLVMDAFFSDPLSLLPIPARQSTVGT
jgi:predicted NBD/HSP70 family sugar kinase